MSDRILFSVTLSLYTFAPSLCMLQKASSLGLSLSMFISAMLRIVSGNRAAVQSWSMCILSCASPAEMTDYSQVLPSCFPCETEVTLHKSYN